MNPEAKIKEFISILVHLSKKKTNLGTPVCTIIDEFLENF